MAIARISLLSCFAEVEFRAKMKNHSRHRGGAMENPLKLKRIHHIELWKS
jgi:hypothetical protein